MQRTINASRYVTVPPDAGLLDPAVLIEGVLFRARYLGSTQLVCEGQPTKSTRMMQAEEAVSRIKVSALLSLLFLFRALLLLSPPTQISHTYYIVCAPSPLPLTIPAVCCMCMCMSVCVCVCVISFASFCLFFLPLLPPLLVPFRIPVRPSAPVPNIWFTD